MKRNSSVQFTRISQIICKYIMQNTAHSTTNKLHELRHHEKNKTHEMVSLSMWFYCKSSIGCALVILSVHCKTFYLNEQMKC